MILHRYICCYYHWVSSYVSHLNPNFQNRPDICQEYNINYCASLFWGSFHTTWHILDTSTYLVGTHQLGGEDVNILSRLIPKHQFSGNLWSYHTVTMLPFLLIWKSKSNIKYSPTQNPRFCWKKNWSHGSWLASGQLSKKVGDIENQHRQWFCLGMVPKSLPKNWVIQW